MGEDSPHQAGSRTGIVRGRSFAPVGQYVQAAPHEVRDPGLDKFAIGILIMNLFDGRIDAHRVDARRPTFASEIESSESRVRNR